MYSHIQNDQIDKDVQFKGCLFISHINALQALTEVQLDRYQIDKIYQAAQAVGAIRTDSEYTCYVTDHEKLIKTILQFMGFKTPSVIDYSGRYYFDGRECHGSISAGSYFIIQWKTDGGNSHFTWTDFDSWQSKQWPMKKYGIISIRAYTVEV